MGLRLGERYLKIGEFTHELNVVVVVEMLHHMEIL